MRRWIIFSVVVVVLAACGSTSAGPYGLSSTDTPDSPESFAAVLSRMPQEIAGMTRITSNSSSEIIDYRLGDADWATLYGISPEDRFHASGIDMTPLEWIDVLVDRGGPNIAARGFDDGVVWLRKIAVGEDGASRDEARFVWGNRDGRYVFTAVAGSEPVLDILMEAFTAAGG